MGLDVSCVLVAGVPMRRVVRLTNKTKYNEDTGEPYNTVVKKKVFEIVGTDIVVNRNDDDDIFHCIDHESDHGWFLGYEVRRTGSHRGGDMTEMCFRIDEGEINAAVSKAQTLLHSYGYDDDPQLIVFQHMIY